MVRLVPRSIEESARRGDDVTDQSRTLVVLSAATGEVVRTVETDERVLGLLMILWYVIIIYFMQSQLF